MAQPNTPGDIETPKEPFLQEEPPQEVVDNIRRLVIISSGVTDPEEIEEKIKAGLKIVKDTRRGINKVFENLD